MKFVSINAGDSNKICYIPGVEKQLFNAEISFFVGLSLGAVPVLSDHLPFVPFVIPPQSSARRMQEKI